MDVKTVRLRKSPRDKFKPLKTLQLFLCNTKHVCDFVPDTKFSIMTF